jgi:parallel beta-helix repeat protein
MKILLNLIVLVLLTSTLSAQTRPHWLDIKKAPAIDVRLYGAKGNGSTDDSAAIQAAITAAAVGETVYIPPTTAYYKITATSLSDAILVNKRIRLVIDGELRATSAANQANPPYIVNIASDDVVVSGSGTLRGSGSYVVNETTQLNRPGLMRVTGKRVNISGLTFASPQEVALLLYGARGSMVTGCTFTGGPVVASATSPQHFYISMGGDCDNTLIDGNYFLMDSGGGSTRQAVESTGYIINGLRCTNNTFHNIHEHCTYVFANNSVCSHNTLTYDTARAAQLGQPIKWAGNYNVISNNTIYGSYVGGIILHQSTASIISNNNLNVAGVALRVSQGAYNNDHPMNYNVIDGNICKCLDTTVGGTGIFYVPDDLYYPVASASFGGRIINNTIIGYGVAAANKTNAAMFVGRYASPSPGYFAANYEISGNTITGSNNFGIYLENVNNSIVSRNHIYNNPCAHFTGIYLNNCDQLRMESNLLEDTQAIPTMDYGIYATLASDVLLLNNECYGASGSGTANVFQISPPSNIQGTGNRVSRLHNLRGVFAIDGVGEKTIANTNITMGAPTESAIGCVVRLTPLNSAASEIQAGSQAVYVASHTPGVGFTVKTGNATVIATGTNPVYTYDIQQ